MSILPPTVVRTVTMKTLTPTPHMLNADKYNVVDICCVFNFVIYVEDNQVKYLAHTQGTDSWYAPGARQGGDNEWLKK